MAVNPRERMEIMSGANDDNCRGIGTYNTSDGGATWIRSCETAPPGVNPYSDPILGYGLKGNAYRGGIDATPSGSVSLIGVSRSKDNGKTWGSAFVAVPQYFPGSYGLADKPWMQIDTSSGKVPSPIYISVTQFDSSNNTQITVSSSTDEGKKWKIVPVGAEAFFPNINQDTDITIDNAGTVYVSWMFCTANGPSGSCAGTVATQMLSKSKDGGKTWSAPAAIHTVNLALGGAGCFYGCLPNTNIRVLGGPVIAVDNSKKGIVGKLYLADYNWTGSYMRVQVSSSTDGGTTWSAPVPVAPPSDTHDQFMQWLNISDSGLVGVSWLDRRNDPRNIYYEAFGAYSSNGGATFRRNFDLSANPSDPFNDGFGGTFLGDYSGNGWAGEALYVTYPDTSNGTNAQDMLGGFLLP
jgi:hypothetical protein